MHAALAPHQGGIAERPGPEAVPDDDLGAPPAPDRQGFAEEPQDIARGTGQAAFDAEIHRADGVIERGNQHGVLVGEVMGDRAGGAAGGRADIGQLQAVDAALRDDPAGGRRDGAPAAVVIDDAWH